MNLQESDDFVINTSVNIYINADANADSLICQKDAHVIKKILNVNLRLMRKNPTLFMGFRRKRLQGSV